MEILFDIFQFVESAILFSIIMFCIYMYIKTRDSFIKKTIQMVLPVTLLFLMSIFYSYLNVNLERYYTNAEYIIENFSFLFAAFAIILIALSIDAACSYVISLLDDFKKYVKTVKITVLLIIVIFMVLGMIYITRVMNQDIKETLNRALWIFYPLGSLIPFLLSVSIYFYYKKIHKKYHSQLAKNFLIAFTPQILYTALDFFVFKQFEFQFTHISYIVFSILSFYNICNHYFNSYEAEGEIRINEKGLKTAFDFSEREMEVVELLLKGETNQKIGEELYISINTVKSHIKNIYKKAEVTNRVQLIYKIKEKQ